MNDFASAEAPARLQIPRLRRAQRARSIAIALFLLGSAAAGAYWLLRPAVPVERYRTDPVSRRDIVRVVEASGRIDVPRRFDVPSPIPGILTEVLVAERALVARGQALARLDAQSAEFAVRGAQASVAAATSHIAEARATLEAARRERERTAQLAARGLASEADLAAAVTAVTQATAALSAANASARVATENLSASRHGASLTEIVAPAAGVVLVVPSRVGAAVGPERGPLFVIGESLDPMHLAARVSEADVGSVEVGQAAAFDVPAHPGRVFNATVTRISLEPAPSDTVVLYEVVLAAPNPEGALMPGMTANVRIEVAREEGVLAVREAALRFAPEDADEAPPRSRLFVHVGLSTLDELAIVPGISDGAYTAVTPREGTLADGARVAIGLVSPEASTTGRPGIRLGGAR